MMYGAGFAYFKCNRFVIAFYKRKCNNSITQLRVINKEVFGVKKRDKKCTFFSYPILSVTAMFLIMLCLTALTEKPYMNGLFTYSVYGNRISGFQRVLSWPYDMVEYEEIDTREEGLEMEGRIPALTHYARFIQSRINSEIDRIINGKIADAREVRARVLIFDYETAFSAPYMSIILKSTAASASSKTEVVSINFDINTGEFIHAEDVVGPHVVQLADRLLVEMIRRNPERYNPGFAGMRDDQAFSVTDDEITFWFNEFQLAPGFEGIVPLTLRLDDIKEHELSRDDFHIRREFNLKMVPVRIVEHLGYTFTWHRDPEYPRVTIYHNDELVIDLTIGVNDYVRESRFTRVLEAAPELINGTTFVPISFFDQILSLVAYYIDHEDNITFASYPVSDEWFER